MAIDNETVKERHLRIQASLTRCDDCGCYFQDIEKHIRESITVKAIESEK